MRSFVRPADMVLKLAINDDAKGGRTKVSFPRDTVDPRQRTRKQGRNVDQEKGDYSDLIFPVALPCTACVPFSFPARPEPR